MASRLFSNFFTSTPGALLSASKSANLPLSWNNNLKAATRLSQLRPIFYRLSLSVSQRFDGVAAERRAPFRESVATGQ